jgi:hypothetical protein
MTTNSDEAAALGSALRLNPVLGSAMNWVRATLDSPVLGPIVAAFTKQPSLLAAAEVHPDPLVRLGLAANEGISAGGNPLASGRSRCRRGHSRQGPSGGSADDLVTGLR